MDEETALHAAICHYALWKAAQQQGQKASPVTPSTAAAAPKPANGTDAAGSETIPDATAPAGKDGAPTRPAATNDDITETNTFAQIAEMLQKETPALRALRARMPTDTPPYIIARFSMFPQLHQDLMNERAQNQALHQGLMHERAQNQALHRQVYDLQVTLSRATSTTFGGVPNVPTFGGAEKRKSPPGAAAPPASAGDSSSPAKPSPQKKARKVDPNRPITMQMKVASRSDVPEDVKNFITMVRKDLGKEKRKNKRLQTRVEEAKALSDQLSNTEKAPPPPSPKPAPPPAESAKPSDSVLPSDYVYKPRGPVQPPVSWDERMKELEHFYKGNGHCRAPSKEPLGRWVVQVRKEWRCLRSLEEWDRNEQLDLPPDKPYHLTHERLAKLNEMGFEWEPRTKPVPFDVRYQQLIEYKEKHGHLRISRLCNDPPGIGAFIYNMRKDYKRKAKVIMGERVKKLNDIGFIWDTNQYKPSFEERLEECRDFRREHGHLSVPPPPATSPKTGKKKKDGDGTNDESQAETPEEQGNEGTVDKKKSFLAWAQRMRLHHQYFQQGKKSVLDKGRIRKLDALGFVWEPQGRAWQRKDNQRFGLSREEAYNIQLEKLKHIKASYGDVNDINNIRAAYPGDESLLIWMKRQRKSYKNKRLGEWHALTAERQLALDALGFDFEPYRDHAPYGSLKKAAAAENPLSPPPSP